MANDKNSTSRAFLAWCDKHAFVVGHEAPPSVTALVRYSCGCCLLPHAVTNEEAIAIVKRHRHAKWVKRLIVGNFHFHIVRY